MRGYITMRKSATLRATKYIKVKCKPLGHHALAEYKLSGPTTLVVRVPFILLYIKGFGGGRV